MEKIEISGKWLFTKDDPSKTAEWEEVIVPHTWNNIDGQDGGNDYYRGLCFYKKELQINNKDKRVYIEFEGANSIAHLYINGNNVGTHKGGYSTFRFDITDYITSGNNEILVGVDNSNDEDVFPLMADFTFYGGIYRTCSLIFTSKVGFDLSDMGSSSVFVKQEKTTKDKAIFDVECQVRNFDMPVDAEISVSVIDNEGVILLSQLKPMNLTEQNKVVLSFQLDNPHLWDGVDDPYLYTINADIIVKKEVVDSRSIKTGFRFFHIDENAFFLNGKKVRLNGVSRHQDRLNYGNALKKEHHEEDIKIIKEMGANSIRLAHYQQDQYFYDLCDEYGFIVWAEIPYISRPSKTDYSGTNALSQLEELIKQNYNHPSIVMWGIQNEVTIGGKKHNLEAIVQELHNLAKDLDPARYTTQANVIDLPVDDSLSKISDLEGYNTYFGWYYKKVEDISVWLEKFRKNNPNRPICISEYGVEGNIQYHSNHPIVKDYTEEFHALWHEKTYEILSNIDYVWGTYVWNMFTFGSDVRQEGGIKGKNNKGLVSFDRKIKKDAFYYYQAKWSKTPMLHLTSKRFTKRFQRDIVIKVYSNLKQITILLNGKEIKNIDKKDVVYTAGIHLAEGENYVQVTGGSLKDEVKFYTVDEPCQEYIVPERKSENSITFDFVENWFDTGEKFNPDEIDSNHFSVVDSIDDLISNTVTSEIFMQYFSVFEDNNIIDTVRMMSLEKLSHHIDIPDMLLVKVNKELQKIKK
ncbi:MAG: glycoside hydrolase family 2 protein [Candidatus Izemoplasmataceae bacterium]